MSRAACLSFVILAISYVLAGSVPGRYIVELEDIQALGVKQLYSSVRS